MNYAPNATECKTYVPGWRNNRESETSNTIMDVLASQNLNTELNVNIKKLFGV